MEHVITVAFDFDDRAVSKAISSKVEKEVISTITKEVEKRIFESRSYFGEINPERDNLSMFAEEIIKGVFAEHKDEIIKKTVDSLKTSIMKSKKYRDAVNATLEDN